MRRFVGLCRCSDAHCRTSCTETIGRSRISCWRLWVESCSSSVALSPRSPHRSRSRWSWAVLRRPRRRSSFGKGSATLKSSSKCSRYQAVRKCQAWTWRPCSLCCARRAEELHRKRAEHERHQQELARVQARVDASNAELKAVGLSSNP